MPRTAEQIITDIKIAANARERRLDVLTDDAETTLLTKVLATENRLAARLQGLLPQFMQGKVGDDFRILNNSENIDIAARIYSIVQSELQPFSEEATQWAIDNFSDAYMEGVQATVDNYNAGAEEDMAFSFGEQDAMVMEIALTKGYGKEQRGIGKIKDITQETADSIRDIMLRGIYEQKTTTQLMADLHSPDVGLTSLEIFDSRGRKRTLSVRQRAKLIAQNEIAAIYQTAAVEKARDIFDGDPFWYYGSVYEPSTMTDWCKKRFGRIAKLSEWNDADWVRSQFNDSKTGTGHIHVNCRQSGYAVSEEWFKKTDWNRAIGNGKPGQHILTGEDLADYRSDGDAKIPVGNVFGELPKIVIRPSIRARLLEYKPVDTLEEAINNLLDQKRYRYIAITDDAQEYNVALNWLNAFEEVKQDLITQFGKKKINALKGFDIIIQSMGPQGAMSVGALSLSADGSIMLPEMQKEMDDFTYFKNLEPFAGGRIWAVSETWKGTVKHELMHAIDKLNYYNHRELYDDWRFLWNEKYSKSDKRDWIRLNISDYANCGKPSEFLAEAANLYTQKNYEKGWLPSDIEEYLDRFFTEGNITLDYMQNPIDKEYETEVR